MKGGKRPGAGRKPGSLNKRSLEIVNSGLTPLAYMLGRLRDENEDASVRADMAKAAAPYCHAKLAAIEHTGKDGEPLQVVFARVDQSVL